MLTIPFPVPKKNSRVNTRSGRSFPSARYTKWHRAAQTVVQNQLGNYRSPLSCALTVAIFWAPDKRKRDLTNLYQSIEDLFNDMKVWADDNYFVQPALALFFGGVDKYNPRVDVFLLREEEFNCKVSSVFETINLYRQLTLIPKPYATKGESV